MFKKDERGEMDWLSWIIVLVIVGGIFGVGPCANTFYCGGPKLASPQSEGGK